MRRLVLDLFICFLNRREESGRRPSNRLISSLIRIVPSSPIEVGLKIVVIIGTSIVRRALLQIRNRHPSALRTLVGREPVSGRLVHVVVYYVSVPIFVYHVHICISVLIIPLRVEITVQDSGRIQR